MFTTGEFQVGNVCPNLHRHKIWARIAPEGKMTSDQFVKFIVENKIGTGRPHDALNMFKMMVKLLWEAVDSV
jgi:hypothetical protein